MKNVYLILILLGFASHSYAISESVDEAKTKPDADDTSSLDQFGFGPAFFMIAYDEEVLKDSKDVSVRGDGAIAASGSKHATALGLEVHFDFTFLGRRYGNCKNPGDVVEVTIGDKTITKCGASGTDWKRSNGFLASPFLGVYDIEDGINGMVAGVVVGYWTGDGNFENRSSINFGFGYTVHRDRLVLADGVNEGQAPPSGLTTADYTTRKDVEGLTLMVSVSTNF